MSDYKTRKLIEAITKVLGGRYPMRTYKRWEGINEHSKNVVLLAFAVGNDTDRAEALAIYERHMASENGIEPNDYAKRQEIHMRLYKPFVEYCKFTEAGT